MSITRVCNSKLFQNQAPVLDGFIECEVQIEIDSTFKKIIIICIGIQIINNIKVQQSFSSTISTNRNDNVGLFRNYLVDDSLNYGTPRRGTNRGDITINKVVVCGARYGVCK